MTGVSASLLPHYSFNLVSLMVVGIGNGVLYYEAMHLSPPPLSPSFGVRFNDATRGQHVTPKLLLPKHDYAD